MQAPVRSAATGTCEAFGHASSTITCRHMVPQKRFIHVSVRATARHRVTFAVHVVRACAIQPGKALALLPRHLPIEPRVHMKGRRAQQRVAPVDGLWTGCVTAAEQDDRRKT